MTEGDKQHIQVRVLRKPSQPDPANGVAIGVNAGPDQGYFWDLGNERLEKLVDGKLVELKKE